MQNATKIYVMTSKEEVIRKLKEIECPLRKGLGFPTQAQVGEMFYHIDSGEWYIYKKGCWTECQLKKK